MSSLVRLLAVVAVATMVAVRQPDKVTFVVSPRSSIQNLSRAELRRIFLGQTSRWSDRRRIVICLPNTNSPEVRIVLDRVVRMSAIDYSQHWLGAVFRGEASSPPHVFDSRESLIRAVSENDDAIGFVLTSEQPVAPARAITIDHRQPQEPSYPVAY